MLESFTGDQIVHSGVWPGFGWMHQTGADPRDSPRFASPDLTPEQWWFIADLLLAGKHYE